MHVQTCKLASVPSAAVASRAPNSLVYNDSHIGRLVEINMPPKLLKGKLVFVGPHAKVFINVPRGQFGFNNTVSISIFDFFLVLLPLFVINFAPHIRRMVLPVVV